MGGCLDFLTYAGSGCACFAECHVYNICCDDIDWIKCSCQNVRDIYHKDEGICNYHKFNFECAVYIIYNQSTSYFCLLFMDRCMV